MSTDFNLIQDLLTRYCENDNGILGYK